MQREKERAVPNVRPGWHLALAAGCALATLGGALDSSPAVAHEEKRIYGWVENVTLPAASVEVKAKLDSGALTSSMHARDIERFTRSDEEWVRFTVDLAESGEASEYERPLYRDVLIRGAGGAEHRPVVLMQICFGERIYEEQFTLNDRGDMIYPVLIGRRTIQHLGLLDVTRTFLHPPDCTADSPLQRHGEHEVDGDIGTVD